MKLLFYNLLVLLLLPLWLVKLARKQKGYLRLKERIGLLPRSSESPLWIHSVSLGEAKLAVKLADHLKEKAIEVFLTATTAAGLQFLEGKGYQFAAFPLDFYLFQKLALRRVAPRAVIAVETEIWPSLFKAAERLGKKVFIVNGRLSDKNINTYIKIRAFMNEILGICHVSAASSGYLERFRELGVSGERSVSFGNMKFDIDEPGEEKINSFRTRLAPFLRPSGRKLWIAGSAREGEEQLFLKVQKDMLETGHAGLILAPRHLDKVGKCLELCWKMGLRPALRTEFPTMEWDVLILDTYGELFQAYALADVAVIGGTFLPFGGQNPLEPAFFKKPVLSGPHFNNFLEETNSLVSGGGALIVEDPAGLAEVIRELFNNDVMNKNMGVNAFNTLNISRGATLKTALWLEKNLA